MGTLDSRYENVIDWMSVQSLEGELVDEPDSEDGTTPDGEEPEDPEPVNPVPTTPEPTETGSSDTLPATATNKFNMILVGLSLLIVGTILAVIISEKMPKSS